MTEALLLSIGFFLFLIYREVRMIRQGAERKKK